MLLLLCNAIPKSSIVQITDYRHKMQAGPSLSGQILSKPRWFQFHADRS